MINNIVFDFGGVLVQYDFVGFFTRLLGSRDKAGWFLQHVLPQSFNDECDLGLHPFHYHVELRKRQWPEYADVLDHFESHYVEVITGETPGMRELMTELRQRGHRLLGLSNWSERVNDVMAKYDIFSLLDGCLISKDVHQLKPEPDIYESFMAKFQVKASDCIFIDDREENVEGARRVGMDAVVFHDVPQLRQELTKRNILSK